MAFLGKLFQVIVKDLQQELIVVPESQPGIPDLSSRDVRIPVTDTLVLLADVGLDVLQFLIDRCATILLPDALVVLVYHSLKGQTFCH